MMGLVSITENKAITTSLIVAEAFEKQHSHVLRAIRELDCSAAFNQSNFGPVAYTDPKGELRPMYQITRDGFTFLAMGFTGKKAAEFKEKFIAAFNAMEAALLEGRGERRQVDVNHRHQRGITNPHGLDVKYTLDLTKVALKPTKAGLEILERITGVDLSDIDLSLPPTVNELSLDGWLQTLVQSATASCLLKDHYDHFEQWHDNQLASSRPLPSRKWLAAQLRKRGYRVYNRGGSIWVDGLVIEVNQ